MAADRLRLPAVLAAAAVLAQICYPLTDGRGRDVVTGIVVLLFAAASASHVVLTRRALGVCAVLLIVLGGFAVEVLGVHTGFPFGRYAYASSLGPRLWGVPLLIGAAWMMLAWPAAVAAHRLARTYAARVVVGAWALASWDLFLDPQMVADGHWTWRHPAPHLPGVDGVPLTNYAGWVLVSFALSLVLQAILPSAEADPVPLALFLWTYFGSVLAFVAFLDLPAAAGWGALGMGVVALPLTVRLLRRRVPVRAMALR